MYVKVRTVDGKTNLTVTISKLTSVKDFRAVIERKLGIKREKQRFFYRGKQLEDDYKMFDYDIRLNDVIQLMVKPDPEIFSLPSTTPVETATGGRNQKTKEKLNSSKFYKVGDLVDVRKVSGAWFEGRIVDILKRDGKSGTETVKFHTLLDETYSGDLEDTKIGGKTTIDVKGTTGSSADDTNISNIVNHKSICSEADKLRAFHEELPENEVEIFGDSSRGRPEDYILVMTESDKRRQHGTVSPSNVLNEGSSESSTEIGALLKDVDSRIMTENLKDDGFLYNVVLEGYENEPPVEVNFEHIRPRARYKCDYNDLKINDVVMANYNIENPKCRGYWYDVCITEINRRRRGKEIVGFLYGGGNAVLLDNCKIIFCDDILKIEKPIPVAARSIEIDKLMQTETTPLRQNALNCPGCHDDPRVECRECSCYICGGKDDPGTQILCDECDTAYHIRCLDPPLEAIPDTDDWYCPDCKNDENEIVKAGEKLKESKKKAKLHCMNAKSTRDWGKGMACVGRTKECTLVPRNHYGPIPGVEVGTSWLYRVQVSESGVHRPHVGGIHGRESDGAYSIVLSGGYEDDVDNGNEFLYTGSGGRDLSGNKRTADQSHDQTLTRLNKALALNCNTELNSKGAKAKNWKGGKPVRVVRNYKLGKYSKYAPQVGNRYDGIYKVVEYYPEKGKSGFIVWRFRLRRDDDSPAPWTPQGKKLIKLYGLEKAEVPEGYLEAKEEKLEPEEQNYKGQRMKSKKRSTEGCKDSSSLIKRPKIVTFKLDSSLKKMIDKDVNTKLWDLCSEHLKDGKQKFIAKVAETFMCICCQELVHKPITTVCKHNFCKNCLQRSFAAKVYTCPCCRHYLGKKYNVTVNETLSFILCKLFPGYDQGR
jgi:E3 ubiquitin-protein ligase UHRF1